MAGIIGGILGGLIPSRPMAIPAGRILSVPTRSNSDKPATSGQSSNLPVAIVTAPRTSPTPQVYDLFVNQFTTPSTAAVASIAFAESSTTEYRSMTEVRAHASYSAVADAKAFAG